MLSKKQKSDVKRAYKFFRSKFTKNDLDLKWSSLINKYNQNGKIVVIFSSDSLIEDFDDGTKLVQKPCCNDEVVILNAQYTAFKHYCNYFDRYADSPYFIQIDYPNNHKKERSNEV